MGVDLVSEATCMLTTERTWVLSASWTWVLLAGVVAGLMVVFLTLPYRSPGYLDAEKSDCQKGVRFGMAIFPEAGAPRSCSGRFVAGAGLPVFAGARVSRPFGWSAEAPGSLPPAAAAGAARSPLFLAQYCTV